MACRVVRSARGLMHVWPGVWRVLGAGLEIAVGRASATARATATA